MTTAAARPIQEGSEPRRPTAREAPTPSPVPSQRASHRLIVPAPVTAGWDGYSNAGPDVYWSPDGSEALAS
jgi:hypothetical protein